MDLLLIANGIFLCFLTFTLYSFKLYAWNSSWNLMLCVFIFWFGFFIYDANRDIIFVQKQLKDEKISSLLPKGEDTGENNWEVV